MINIQPTAALELLHREFPHAAMEAEIDTGGRLYGYTFYLGRSRHFAQRQDDGGVDYGKLRLFYDCEVYARNKRLAKRA